MDLIREYIKNLLEQTTIEKSVEEIQPGDVIIFDAGDENLLYRVLSASTLIRGKRTKYIFKSLNITNGEPSEEEINDPYGYIKTELDYLDGEVVPVIPNKQQSLF